MGETIGNYGISYLIDNYLYEKMASWLEAAGLGKVSAKTYYGYTEYIVRCDSRNTAVVLSGVQKIMDDTSIDKTIFEKCSEYLLCRTNKRKPVYLLYNEKRVPNSRLAFPVSFPYAKNDCALYEHAQKWYVDTIMKKNKVIIQTLYGANNYFEQDLSVYACTPYVDAPISTIAIPKHIPWKQSLFIKGMSFKREETNILCLEALCQRIRPMINQRVSSVSGRVNWTQISMDFFGELRVCGSCAKGKEPLVFEAIRGIFGETNQVNASIMRNLATKIFDNYRTLCLQPDEWNRFIGWNLMSGGWYVIPELFSFNTFSQSISEEGLGKLVHELSLDSLPSEFVIKQR